MKKDPRVFLDNTIKKLEKSKGFGTDEGDFTFYSDAVRCLDWLNKGVEQASRNFSVRKDISMVSAINKMNIKIEYLKNMIVTLLTKEIKYTKESSEQFLTRFQSWLEKRGDKSTITQIMR